MPDHYYRSGELLREKNARVSTSSAAFPRWALDRADLPDRGLVVDVGCGWGRFALEALSARPRVTLAAVDVWPGMVMSCREALDAAGLRAGHVAGDGLRLPLRGRVAALVMANHMLYEFANPADVIKELTRIARDDGGLLATTYSDAAPIPLLELHAAALSDIGVAVEPSPASTFSLENGESQLAEFFSEVSTHVLEVEESVTEPRHLTETYVRTGRYQHATQDPGVPTTTREALASAFERRAREAIARDGAIDWVTRWTAFVARVPRR